MAEIKRILDEPTVLWNGNFLDGKLTLIGVGIKKADYEIAFVITTRGDVEQFEGKLELELSSFSNSERMIEVVIDNITNLYITEMMRKMNQDKANGTFIN